MKQLPQRCRSARRAADEPMERFRVWREARRGFVTRLCAVALLATSLLLATTPLRAQYDSYPDAEWIDGGGLSPQRGAVWTPDERFVISATAVGDLIVWNAATHHLVRYLRRNLGAITSMDVSWTHDLLAIGTGSGDILEVSATTGQDVRVLHGHQSAVVDVKFSADERYLVSAGYGDLRVILWDAASGDSLAAFTGNKSYINDVAISADGHYVATAGADFTARVWDTRTGEQIYEFIWALRTVGAVAFSRDSKYLAAVDDMGDYWSGDPPALEIFSIDSGLAVRSLIRAPHTRDVAFSADGRYIVCSDIFFRAWHGGGFSVFEFDNGDTLFEAAKGGFGNSTNAVRFSPGGSRLLLPDEDGELFCLDLDLRDGLLNVDSNQFATHTAPIRALDVAADATAYVTGTASGRAKTWSVDNGDSIRTIIPNGFEVRSARFSPDGRTIAVCAMNGVVTLFDALKGDSLRTLYASADNSVNDAAWSPDGHRIVGAIGPADSTAVAWDTASPTPDERYVGHRGGLWSVVWTPDGQYLATAGDDGAICVWTANASLIATAYGHDGRINTLALSNGGAMLASGGIDGTVRLWAIPSCDPIGVLRGHTAPVTDVAFLPDDRSIATASTDGTIRIWSLDELVETNRYSAYPFAPVALGVAADGTWLLSAMEDGSVIRWRLRTVAGAPDLRVGTCDAAVVRPDPVHTAATITFDIPTSGFVRMRVVDVLGATVATVASEQLNAGHHAVRWQRGGLPPGEYFLAIESNAIRRITPFIVR